MPSQLTFGVNDAGFVVLGLNDYNYSKNDVVMKLLREYKKVQFDNNFDTSVDWLPDGITDIHFGRNFNKRIENIPSTVKRIRIGTYNNVNIANFNQPLDYLPSGLEELTIKFCNYFNHPLDNLPPGLNNLYLTSHAFNYPINNLPNNLEYLTISHFDYNNTFSLPSSLKSITISEYKCNVENLNEPEYNGLRNLQNNHPNTEFIYKF
jgi:hypothetical protein